MKSLSSDGSRIIVEVQDFPKEEREQNIRYMTTERDIINQKAFARNRSCKGRGYRNVQSEAKGRTEGRSEVARAMLLENISIETIAKVSGLSAEQIRAL